MLYVLYKTNISLIIIKYTSDKYIHVRIGVYKFRYCYLNVLNR